MRSLAERVLLSAVLAGGAVAPALAAADIQIINGNGAGIGFGDAAPANPAAGANGGATLGQQRLRVLQRAAEIWGAALNSPVPIRVHATMVNQTCGTDGTTLATAGPANLAHNFPNAPRANTAYHIAQANALRGQDLTPGEPHIVANFNLAIDAGCSPNTVGWWYGIDPGVPVPTDRIALLPVALHELAHGLGFSAQTNLDTGGFAGSHPPLWHLYLYDLETMRHWRTMSAGERVLSARNDPDLVWSGNNVNRNLETFLSGAPALVVEGPRPFVDEVTELGLAEFGAGYPPAPLAGRVMSVNDGVVGTGEPAGTVSDGCEFPFRNGARLAGRIALIDRGFCAFVQKARHAQQHGAIAAIIVNNVDGAPPTMAGSDPAVTIPVVGVTREIGARFRQQLFRPQLRLRFDHTEELAGVRQGCARMFAPETVQPGSSVSHFHTAAFPNLLMEPSISRSLFEDLDLTIELFRDLGWPLAIAALPASVNACPAGPLP